jgi:hypothetical protein
MATSSRTPLKRGKAFVTEEQSDELTNSNEKIKLRL